MLRQSLSKVAPTAVAGLGAGLAEGLPAVGLRALTASLQTSWARAAVTTRPLGQQASSQPAEAEPQQPTCKMAPGWTKDSYMLMHPVYEKEYVESIKPSHRPPTKLHEHVGYNAVQAARKLFDYATGYGDKMTEKKWLARMLYLETVAGVPGMVAGMLRHMRSLRTMQRDHGWIHTLLEEAENERMHLLTFMKMRDPGLLFRGAVLLGQGIFFNLYMLSYMASPKTCHSFVGYLEEEAVKTYTRAIEELDRGELPEWTSMPAPDIGVAYWRLEQGATVRDLLLAIRADEACHMHVNHTLSAMRPNDPNPFGVGTAIVP